MTESEGELTRLVDQLNRSVTNSNDAENSTLDRLLTTGVQRQASDIILVAGSSAVFRVKGALTAGMGAVLTATDLRSLLLPMLTPGQLRELQERRSLDLCFVRNAIGRFRVNLHFQRNTLAAAIRILPEQIPSLELLHLPPGLASLGERRQGLVLVTGPTGCGKSSTLAALIHFINSRRRDHIITIENPIEYQHPNHSSIVEQVELGHDTPSFAEAVRAA
jgi:twitching motility protein PilT